MKNLKKYLTILLFTLFFSFGYAQLASPPNGDGDSPGSPGNVVGGGAPIGSGLLVLMTAAGAYGYTKLKNNTPTYEVKE